MKVLIVTVHDAGNRIDVQDAVRCARDAGRALQARGHRVSALGLALRDFRRPAVLRERLHAARPDCIFNLFEGFAEDPRYEADFAGILEDACIPFTGNGARSLRLCLDKPSAKQALQDSRIPVPQGLLVRNPGEVDPETVACPVFIKPCCEDASLGIDAGSLVTDKDRLRDELARKLKAFPRGLMVEEFISGIEYNAGFLGKFPYELVGLSVMDYTAHADLAPFLTYSAKWDSAAPEYRHLVPSSSEQLDQDLCIRVAELAGRSAGVLGCRSYFRVDIRERDGELFVLDVNPNPDINTDSGFMRQAYRKGYSYGEVIEKILQGAMSSGHEATA